MKWGGKRKGSNNPNYKDGRHSKSDYMKNWRLNNKEKLKNYNQISHDMAKEFRDKFKHNPCSDCQINYPPYVMHFDHREGTLKLFNIGAEVGRKSLQTIEKEILKCDVVCANCHAIRTHNRRILCVS